MTDNEMIVNRILKTTMSFYRKIGPQTSHFKEMGLTPPQFHVLNWIAEEGPGKITQLAEIMEVKPSAITVMIDRMENNQLVTRHHDETDRRVVMVSITEHGLKILKEARKRATESIRNYYFRLDPSELEVLLAIYEKLENIADTAEPSPKLD
ncbi:MarR family winged helix-turn-helix transcriptional regulator [Paenibacillus lutrae]|uniref:MarR family transcriptional regulator n=1 Tax=Paenibacillus lutrae TaxID=2078573 RepID=A0A7X3FGU0_9BACL|nr:MarR family transcriptional regulator [Paenibacillus lutrae]MVO99208.1 MarR family transcriptional regulator [Paenibacillus lutrae]